MKINKAPPTAFAGTDACFPGLRVLFSQRAKVVIAVRLAAIRTIHAVDTPSRKTPKKTRAATSNHTPTVANTNCLVTPVGFRIAFCPPYQEHLAMKTQSQEMSTLPAGFVVVGYSTQNAVARLECVAGNSEVSMGRAQKAAAAPSAARGTGVRMTARLGQRARLFPPGSRQLGSWERLACGSTARRLALIVLPGCDSLEVQNQLLASFP
jgi:hypothetical protein